MRSAWIHPHPRVARLIRPRPERWPHLPPRGAVDSCGSFWSPCSHKEPRLESLPPQAIPWFLLVLKRPKGTTRCTPSVFRLLAVGQEGVPLGAELAEVVAVG